MRKINHIFILIFVLLIFLPAIADACPLCEGSGTKQTDFAYKGITLFLLLLPILGCGGIFYWMYLKNKNIEENIK